MSALHIVQGRFPHLRDRVAVLFEADEGFRELCEDYEACTLALSRPPPHQGSYREYEALRLRLEAELLRHVDESGDSARGGGSGSARQR